MVKVNLATIVIYNLALPNYMLGFGSGLATEYIPYLCSAARAGEIGTRFVQEVWDLWSRIVSMSSGTYHFEIQQLNSLVLSVSTCT